MKISTDLLEAMANWNRYSLLKLERLVAEMAKCTDTDMGAPTLKAQRSAPGEPEYHH